MSVPLESANKILGAIYVDSLGASNRFHKAHLDLLTAIGKQAGIAVERAMLFEHYLEKEKMKQALEIAQNIQKTLLPSGVPEHFEYDIVGWNLTCDETGGDYYDFLELPGQRLGVTVGDVSGHGIGAALLMATARAFLKALAIKCNEITTVINELNKLLEQDMEEDKFMTLFYGEIDIKQLKLRYVNAGHEAPFLYRKHKNTFETLESTGIPLGMMDDFEYQEGQEIELEMGDILVLSTDGITEAMNPEGEQFGAERLREVIQQGVNKSANQIVKDCYDQLQKFCRGTPQRDDLTLVIIKFQFRAESQKTDVRALTRKWENSNG
jgi:sigma-B regulation protein RsbU (phosphoserine phosphatase)